jgi:PAS domain-containing protein
MPVTSVVDGVKLAANHVYVIPPGKHLTTVNGHLQLTALEPEHGRQVAVDLFFRSLADTHGPHAAAIVLSGADGDGAIGIKRIKERGGITISQEELQAMNEELRSASEELETSREELQSINEELTTVNQELKSKVDELGHSNSDLHNLMSSTAIATVFLDRDLRIMRFTPSAVSIFNLIPGDIGRPLSELQHRLDYSQLGDDALGVLHQLIPVERDVSANDGRTFQARLLPYRTLEDRIAGVVLTFVDITERRRVEEALRQRNEALERFNRAAVGRELRMLELKREVNELLARRGEPPQYVINGGEETGPANNA